MASDQSTDRHSARPRAALTIIILPDGSRADLGPGGGEALTVRFTDRASLFAIWRATRASRSAKPTWTGGW